MPLRAVVLTDDVKCTRLARAHDGICPGLCPGRGWGVDAGASTLERSMGEGWVGPDTASIRTGAPSEPLSVTLVRCIPPCFSIVEQITPILRSRKLESCFELPEIF